MAFDIAMGVRKGNTALRDEVDAILARKRAEIGKILDEFGVPRVPSRPGRRRATRSRGCDEAAMPRVCVTDRSIAVMALVARRRAGGRTGPTGRRPRPRRPLRWIRLSELQPGPGPADDPKAAKLVPSDAVPDAYEENAFALSEGKRLFSAFNCIGCHAHGGGDIGPPLIDDRWIYGHEPEQIFATIVEGRPNGMPSFGARIAEYQIWWLVAYVRSLGGLADKDAATGPRRPHEDRARRRTRRSRRSPSNSSLPKAAEMPQ